MKNNYLQDLFSLEGKVALVTGASYGIGYAIASAYAKSGAKIVFCDIKQEFVDKGMAAYTADGIDAKGYVCDVTNEEMVQEMVKKIEAEVGVIDILVNNAGITKDGLLMAMSEADFDDVIDTNLKGCFQMIRFASRRMMKQRYGRIINVSSVSGVAGNAGQANYCASKAGMIGLTKSAAKELASRGITCNAIAPGFVKTEMTEVLSDEVKENAKKQIPLGRFAEPEDIANAAVFLASDKAAYITGQVLLVDGGMVM